MAITIKRGSTDQEVILRALGNDGLPVAGFLYNTAGIDLWYRRQGAAKVSITEVNLAALTTAHADGGVKYIDNGYFRLDLPDAAVASGAASVFVGGTATNMVIVGEFIELAEYDAGSMAVLVRTEMDSNSTRLSAIKSDTGAFSAGGTGLTAIPWNSAWDVEVQSECLAALTSFGGPTVSQMNARTTTTAAYATASALSTVNSNVNAIKVSTDTTIPGTLSGIGGNVTTILSDTGTLKGNATTLIADTTNLKTRVPAALVSGRIDSSVGAMAANTMTAAALASDAVVEIQAGLSNTSDLNTIESNTTAIKGKTDQLLFTNSRIDAGFDGTERQALANALLDMGNGVEAALSMRELLRGLSAAILGQSSVTTGTWKFRNVANTKDVIVSVVDNDQERTSVTLNLS